MNLTPEALKNLINEVMQEAMPPLSNKAKRLTQISKDIEREYDRPSTPEEIANREPLAPNSQFPVSYVDDQLAKREEEAFFLDRDLAARAKTRKGYRNRGIDMGPDDPGDVDDIFPDPRDDSSDEYSREDYESIYGDGLVREGFFSKIFGDDDDKPERSPERQKELEDRLAKMKRGEKIVKPKTADQKAGDMLDDADQMQDELSQFNSMAGSNKFDYIMKNKVLTPKMLEFFRQLPSPQKIQYLKKHGKPKSDLREELMYEGDDSILEQFHGATLEEGDMVCEACLFEQLQEASCGCPDLMGEAEYQGKKVTLNKPTRGDVKKFKVYVKDPSTGNVKKVNFGHGGSSAKAKGEKTMKIRKNNPKARKSFRARHNCDNPGPKTKARYWSCKKW